jgi:three-Cys-motif partner protein
MATPKGTVWEIEPHTLAKHEILRRYLGAWFPILAKHNKRLVYIDGFCGPGKYEGGEVGSPIVALEEALKHEKRLDSNQLAFLFMDERSDRIVQLKSELSDFPIPGNFLVHPVTGQFECELTNLLDELASSGARLAPTFAFIDPFGFKGLPFSLVRRLLGNSKTEVFVNVMVDAINRFLEHPDSKTQQHIVDLFGTQRVLQVAEKPCDRITELRLLYQEQLLACAHFVRYFEMRDCHGRTIYYLFFASNHRVGHVKMKEAFWKVDTSSGFCFSDATNPSQLVLFEIDETPKLAAYLTKEFATQQVIVEQVQKCVEDKTPFIATHMRKALRLLEGENKIAVAKYKSNGKKRRKNTYPKDAVVEFL